ncbi:MAG: FkbM family methyltransferase [Planctomycetota bacterium]|jgi:FkbM family methyltransferase|nr:FkbM family methyltransferase [Planctomycetota bacterium]
MDDSYQFVEIEGLKFAVHPDGDARGQDQGIIEEVVRDDCYLLKALAQASDGKDIRTIVDVGAHVGAFAVRAAAIWPNASIIAVEPNPEVARLCMVSLEANVQSKWEMVDAALAYGCTELELMTHAGGNFASIALPAVAKEDMAALRHDPERYQTSCRVRAITLEDILQRYCPDGIDVLKLDCEGGEIGLFEHASDESLAQVGRIIGEYHHGPGPVMKLIRRRLPRWNFAYLPITDQFGSFVATPIESDWPQAWLQAAVLWSTERRAFLERQHSLRENLLDRVYRLQFRLGRLPLTRQLMALRRWVKHRR